MVFEILIVQNKVKEALALVETARKSSWMLLPVLEIHEARIRYHLGEKDKALATLKKYTEAIKKDVSLTWVVELVDAELAIGRRDQALAVTARMMTIQPAGNWQTTLFEKLFDKQADDAGLLWRLLRSFEPKEPFDKSLARLSAFLEGKASARDVSVLLDRFGKEKFVEAYPREPKEIWRVLGEVALVGKQPERAIEAFRKGGPGGLVRIGDMLAQKKQWAAAAVEYHGAYKQGLQGNLSQGISAEALPCLALWLSGHALTQAGRASEGKAQMERAHLLPLGDAQMRFDFLRVLRRRGHREAARIEADLLRRTGEPSLGDPESYYTGEGLRTAAIEAASKKDWLKAADGYEQTFLRCLHPSMNFARAPAYVSVPSHIFLTRARGLLAAGKIDEALVETERARAMQPGNVEIAMHLVPELDRLGKKKEADALYKAIRDTYMVVIREYANSAFSRNQVAWLSACCRRDLDEALKHVRRAIELTPDSAAYHDTLAEVLFQLGKKDEAIAAQKKAIVLNPTRDYFKKQLKRLEAGDPRTPRPEEE
jgi:tetratricopeptide (TPR) repeat protein